MDLDNTLEEEEELTKRLEMVVSLLYEHEGKSKVLNDYLERNKRDNEFNYFANILIKIYEKQKKES